MADAIYNGESRPGVKGVDSFSGPGLPSLDSPSIGSSLV